MKQVCSLIVAMVLGALYATAYDMAVVFRVDETNEKTIEFAPSLLNSDTGAMLADAQLNDADSAFIFKDAPAPPFLLAYRMDEESKTISVDDRHDTLTVYIPAYYLKKTTMLDEVTVTASGRSLSADKATYIPTAQSKRISANGSQLIENTGITTLRVSPTDGTISTLSGEPVSTFVDFRPASRTDVRNIRAEEVKRIDVYEFPSDPRFSGARHVVNFVMRQYEFGGYTKFDASQSTVINHGRYSAYSKLAYKKMIYDIGVDFDYRHNRHESGIRQSEYIFPDKTVSYTSRTTSSLSKYRNVSAFLRAVYQTSKVVLTNTFSVSRDKSPDNHSEMEEKFSSPDYLSGSASNTYDRSTLSCAWDGNYSFVLPGNFSLVVKPKAAWSKNESDSHYGQQTASISNIVDEKAWTGGLTVNLFKSFGRHSVTAMVYGNGSGNNVDYRGTTPFSQTGRKLAGGAVVQPYLTFGHLTLVPYVMLHAERLKINGVTETSVNPRYYLYASYFFNNKNRTDFTGSIDRQSPSQRFRTDFVQLQSQIMARAGNPDIKNSTWLELFVQHTWMPSDALTITPFINFTYNRHALCYDYQLGVIDGRDMIVERYVNAGNNTEARYGVSVFYRLLNNALSLEGSATGVSQNIHGPISGSGTYLLWYASVRYTWKNFYASCRYQDGYKQISRYGVYHYRSTYGCTVGWGNGNLQLSVTANEPFRSYRGTRSEIYTRYYRTRNEDYSAMYHGHFVFSATYSFSYGKKKVDTYIDTSVPSAPSSQILQ